MSESSDDAADDRRGESADAEADVPEELRERVEEKYDFDNFGPREMDEMTAAEWEAAFDADTWITGPELLDRVERDLRARVARRDVFAVVERETHPDTGEQRLLAYSDEGYAAVYEDGSVEGRGTVLRDVKPSVALCSMDDYEVPEIEEGSLPSPEAVAEGSGDLGNKVLLALGAVQVVAAVVLFGAWLAVGLSVVAIVVAFGFLLFGAFLLVVVANARLSDRFRADEYRARLRDAGVDSDERPAFVPTFGEGEEEDGENEASGEHPDSTAAGATSDAPETGPESPDGTARDT